MVSLLAIFSLAAHANDSESTAAELQSAELATDAAPETQINAQERDAVLFADYRGEEQPQAVFEYVLEQIAAGNWQAFYHRMNPAAQANLDETMLTLIRLEPKNKQLSALLELESGAERFAGVLNTSDALQDRMQVSDVTVLSETIDESGETATLEIESQEDGKTVKDTISLENMNGFWRFKLN